MPLMHKERCDLLSGADVMTVANIDGSDTRTLKAPEGLNYYGARWSPDGTKLVYQERNGGGDTALTGDVGNLFVEDLSNGRRDEAHRSRFIEGVVVVSVAEL